MSAAVLDGNPATAENLLRDPITLSEPVAPAYPITHGSLQDVMEYTTTWYGQIAVRSRVARPRGSHLCYITTCTATPEATWSSVQFSNTHHAELNCALLYVNHSCSPTVEIEVRSPDVDGTYPDGIGGEVRVARDCDLQEGDHLTFFYPSTEWASPRPFKCLCGSDGEKKCIEMQRGSKYLSREILDRYFINKHIEGLVAERDQK